MSTLIIIVAVVLVIGLLSGPLYRALLKMFRS